MITFAHAGEARDSQRQSDEDDGVRVVKSKNERAPDAGPFWLDDWLPLARLARFHVLSQTFRSNVHGKIV